MVRVGLGYLAAADAAQLPSATQAECLRELERDAAVLTAARAGILASFTAGQVQEPAGRLICEDPDRDFADRALELRPRSAAPG